MKVLHISTPSTWRGGEQQLAYLAESLQSMGIAQVIMCPFNSAVHKFCLETHIPHYTFYKGFSTNPLVAYKVDRVCKREGITVIHTHDSHAHNFVYMSALLTNNAVPTVVSRRVDFVPKMGKINKAKYNHPIVKKILCVSDAIQEIMKGIIDDHSKLATVYSGIDLDRFKGEVDTEEVRSEWSAGEDQPIVGVVAALAPHKDLPTFVQTARKLKDLGKNYRYVIIGEGPSRADVEASIIREDMEAEILLTGFRDDVEKLLPVFDVFLITSETEGLGTSVLDAFAAKVPVVATNAGGIVELVEHGVTGLLCGIKQPESLAKAVLQVLSDPDLASQLVQNASAKVVAFSKLETAKKTLQVYESVGLGRDA